MIHYLSDIVSRSEGDVFHSMMPVSMPGPYPDPVAGMDFPGESSSQVDNGQVAIADQAGIPNQAWQAQEVQPPETMSRGKTLVPEKHFERPYLSKHTERVEIVRERIMEKNPLFNSGRQDLEVPSREEGEGPPSVDVYQKGPGFDRKTGRMDIPGKKEPGKQFHEITEINPGKEVHEDEPAAKKQHNLHDFPEEDNQKSTKNSPEISFIRNIIPNPPVNREKAPVQNIIQQESPKLVIGKIIVEIIPPIAPLPRKTITRIVQSTPDSGPSRSNKLSFGLGQL